MKTLGILVSFVLAGAAAFAAPSSTVYVGVITDTMCATNHKPMNISPESTCVKECVRDGKTYKYALADGKGGVYALSDQETPAQFAGRKVKITGVLYPKTNILKADNIVVVK